MPDEIITDALERFRASESGSSVNREKAVEDIRFARLGVQWDAGMKAQRQQEGRPALTINRLPAFIRQVVNDARQNSPAIQVVPVDSGSDVDTAQVIGGLIRAIERGSNAAVAYDTALEHAVSCGFGFFRICTDYAGPDTFDQVAKIERIANPLSVHWDTNSTEFDASDWEFAFVSDMLLESEFKRAYPKAKPVSWEAGRGDDYQDWFGEDKVRVAEYWLRTEIKRKLLLLSDGTVVREDQLTGQAKGALMLSGITPVREREAKDWTVTRRVINGGEVLEETDWPGSMIPICPVWGEEVVIDGLRHFRSMVRDATDPQKMFNFWRSASTELVALAPRAPWIVPEGGIPMGEEGEKWRTANTRSHPYLLYRPSAGAMPQRQPFAGVPAGAIQEALNAADDMKAITGIYDASLGARSNETSGRAIMARQREGDTGTFHFLDNLSRAIQYAGRVLVEIIPSLYSARETIRILGDDQKAKVVKLTQEAGGGGPQVPGQERLYNIAVGRYDVSVKTGPSYTTQREATREALIQLAQAAPQAAPILADMAVRLMDFPDADRAARRLQALLPPQVLAAEQAEGKEGLPPEAQMAMQQLQQQLQQAQAQMQQMGAELQSKQADAQVKGAEIQVKREEVAVKRDELQLKAAEMQARFQAEQEARAAEGQGDAEEAQMQQQMAQALQMLAEQQAQGQALMVHVAQGQQGLADAMAQLAAMSRAPRRLVRDEAGRPIGAEIVT